MNKICKDYVDFMSKKFKSEIKSIIIYGSNIYNLNSSDLDVCLILDKCTKELKNRLIRETLNFHKKYNLKIDDEIPHKNKLIYLTTEIEETLGNPPYYKENKVIINDIIKTKEFLESKEMKQRLLLNILTTDHLTIGRSTDAYEKKAIKIMIDVVCKYYHLENPKADQILNCFYKNQYTGAKEEMYLGYKKNKRRKEKYLLKIINEALND